MSGSMQMQRLISLGKYKLYFANRKFESPGLWIWNGKNNIRIIPFG